MKVETFALQSWASGETSAGINNIYSYKLLINSKLVSDNIPYIRFECDLLQIDVCQECFVIGCSSDGYVQILKSGDIVIWKEPLTIDNIGAYGLRYGTIFWRVEQFIGFLNAILCDIETFILMPEEITLQQGIHLFEIYGNKCMRGEEVGAHYPLERLEEKFLLVYSDDFNNEESLTIYKNARNKLVSKKQCRLIEIPQLATKIEIMFDEKGYGVWDCLYLIGEEVVYSIGDGYGLVFND